jgi:hypothetical protein
VVDNVGTPSKAYYDQLATAFLNGKLYIENPSTIHDLTFYKGQWYLPIPPLGAILMMPLVKIFGDVGFSTVIFSIVVAATNVALVYELLRMLMVRGWINLKKQSLPWLIVLFSVGTIHWYMAIVGTVWYNERLLALNFMLLAVVLALKQISPWWVGLTVGVALWSRPTSIFLWPMLLGIYWQGLELKGKDTVKALSRWTMANAVPIAVSVAGLLLYNWLRFDNLLDFGYQNQNVGINFEAVQIHGFFNISYIPINLYHMWLGLPLLREICTFGIMPDPQGMSILFTSPALIYIVKSFKRSIWIIGAWVALILEMGLLVTQTGKHWAFGYSYTMDMIIPMTMMVAMAVGRRISWLMKILIVVGVVINVWGMAWFFGYYCPM